MQLNAEDLEKKKKESCLRCCVAMVLKFGERWNWMRQCKLQSPREKEIVNEVQLLRQCQFSNVMSHK